MAEEKDVTLSSVSGEEGKPAVKGLEETPKKKPAAKVRKKAARKKIKKPVRKIAVKVEAGPAKKAPKRKPARKAAKKARPAAKVAAPAPTAIPVVSTTILMVPGKAEPIWLKYALSSQTPPSKRPTVPTGIKVGNVVKWSTDAGKERVGVVVEFRGDSAVVDVGGRNELIRVVRLSFVALKMKQL